MAPEVVDKAPKVSEQPEQTSSPSAYSSFRGADTSFTGNQGPGDMAMATDGTQCTTMVDEVDAAAADCLKNAVEDGEGEHWDQVDEKV